MTEKEYRQTRFTRPAGATEILLVRHGESRAARVDEPFPLVDGQGDPELAPQGRNQAELVGARLSALPIDAVYVTKLQRTSETAAFLTATRECSPSDLKMNLPWPAWMISWATIVYEYSCCIPLLWIA